VYSASARVSFWYAAYAAGQRPDGYPFAPPDGESDAAARHVAAQLLEMPRGARASLLAVLHERSARLPWSALHSDWVEGLLVDFPPAWRAWALACLPPPLRDEMGGDVAAAAPPPRWWAEWFERDARRRLLYPELPPWERAALLPGSLWERDLRDLSRLLARHGTRGFVSVVRRLPRDEAQRWLWQLPEACQAEATAVASARAWSDDPFWPEAFRALDGEASTAEARIFRLALADWARAGVQGGQEAGMRRLAFRLPRAWGEWLLRQLDLRPAWLARPVEGDLERWRLELEALAVGDAA
jgi:hypothetical protein